MGAMLPNTPQSNSQERIFMEVCESKCAMCDTDPLDGCWARAHPWCPLSSIRITINQDKCFHLPIVKYLDSHQKFCHQLIFVIFGIIFRNLLCKFLLMKLPDLNNIHREKPQLHKNKNICRTTDRHRMHTAALGNYCFTWRSEPCLFF